MQTDVPKTSIQRFLNGEVPKYIIPDIHRMLQLRPQGNEGLAGCTIPTAMFLFVVADLFGFLVRTDSERPKLKDTPGNLRAIFAHPIANFPTDYSTRVDILCHLFRHGLMHQIFPKAAGIRKVGVQTEVGARAPLFKNFDGLDHLNVDRFGFDVLKMLANFREKLADNSRADLNKQMSERLDQMSKRDFSERKLKQAAAAKLKTRGK